MEELKDLYLNRFNKSAPKITSIFEEDNAKGIPVIISIKSYWSTGSNYDQMPSDYYSNPASMLRYQEEGIKLHLKELDDDYIPYLVPWYGTGILPSAFGCKVRFPEKPGMDPIVESTCINDIKEIRGIKLPDPNKDGLMPRVLETIEFMKKNSVIPVGLTDIQGPMDTIGLMCGYDKIFLWMKDDPNAVHYLFEVVTEALINWIIAQKRITGEKLDTINGEQQVWFPKGVGVWMSEDDLVFIGPKQYEDFIMPCHDKILKKFRSGVIHFCGNGTQHISLLAQLENLAAINTWTLWKFDYIRKLQKVLENKIVLVLGDIAPLNIEEYYEELINNVSLNKIILSLAIEENLALVKKGYVISARKELDTAKYAFNMIKSKLKEKLVQ